MDIHVDNRGFLEIHAWICYKFSGQGRTKKESLTNANQEKYHYIFKTQAQQRSLDYKG